MDTMHEFTPFVGELVGNKEIDGTLPAPDVADQIPALRGGDGGVGKSVSSFEGLIPDWSLPTGDQVREALKDFVPKDFEPPPSYEERVATRKMLQEPFNI